MFNQPKGVFSLSSTEMWERFSFYTIQSILVLYAAASVSKGGLGWSNQHAILITGIYGGAVYATPVLGGIFADKFLGSKKAVALGGILMCLGHFLLAIHALPTFFIALTLLCVGCGLLKPCITAMVGECYQENDVRRDSGFALFYMAINIGGFIGPMVAGPVSEAYGYHVAFVTAGFGLIVGLVNFYIASRKSLKNIGNQFESKQVKKMPHELPKNNSPLTQLEKRKLIVFMAMCVGNIVWNIVYALPYGLLTLYADQNVDRNVFGHQISATWYYGMYSILIVLFSPILAWLYPFLVKKNVNFTLSNKLGVGYITIALGCAALLPMVFRITQDHHARVGSFGLILFYFIFSLSELLTVPVLLSAATKLAPARYVSRMVSFNIVVSWSLGALIAGWVSGKAEHANAFNMFLVLISICVLIGLVHFALSAMVERLCANDEPKYAPNQA